MDWGLGQWGNGGVGGWGMSEWGDWGSRGVGE